MLKLRHSRGSKNYYQYASGAIMIQSVAAIPNYSMSFFFFVN